MAREICFLGSGTIYAKQYGAAAARYRPIGNASQLQLAIEENQLRLNDFQNPGGGVACIVSRITQLTANVTAHNINGENLALAFFGSASSIPTAAVVDESQQAFLDSLVPLENVGPTSVVVTDSGAATTYDEGTDYTVKPGGIFIPEDSTIADDSAILVDYSHPDYQRVGALTDSAPELSLVFDGLNEADEGRPVRITLHRVKFSPAASTDIIGEDFAGLQLPAELLSDPLRTGTGESKFFTWEYAEPDA